MTVSGITPPDGESGEEPTRAPGHRQGAQSTDEWLSTDQLAAELGVTAACIMEWIHVGKDIPHYQLGGHDIRFRRSEIEPLLTEHAARIAGGGVEQLGSSLGS